jgi:hypothetical protein
VLRKERKQVWGGLLDKLAKMNAASLNAVHTCLVNAELKFETKMARTPLPDGRGKIIDLENDLEKSIKKILLKEMKHLCYYELAFPLDDAKNGSANEFYARSRSPDFIVPQIRINNKFLDLDPHHFGMDDDGNANMKHVAKWAEFKRTWGNDLYVVFISHNTEKEVEEQTGTCVDALCDQFLHVGKRSELSEAEVDYNNRASVKQALRELIERSKDQAGYANSQSNISSKEFHELMKRVERGKVVQRYLNATKKVSEDASMTIFRALKK